LGSIALSLNECSLEDPENFIFIALTMTIHENHNPLDLVLGRLTFPHSPALFGLAMSSTVGLLQYIYSVLLVRREGRGPFPLWMHTFYLAHDTTWA
jgi:hypothetical protein